MAKHASKNSYRLEIKDSWIIIVSVIILVVIGEYFAAGLVLLLHQIFMFVSYYKLKDVQHLPDCGFQLVKTVFKYLTPALIAAALIAGVIAIFTKNWVQCAKTAVVFLLLSCPNRLLDVLNFSLYNAMNSICEMNIDVKDYDVLKKLGFVKSLILNKTGTITDKDFRILGVYPKSISENQFISILTKMESNSRHPVALSLGADMVSSADVETTEIQGKGIEGRYGDNSIIVGNATLLNDCGIKCDIPEIYGIAVHMAINGNYCGYIVFENKTRTGTFDCIEMLRDTGIENLYMLSCDLQSVVQPVALALGFDVYKAELNTELKISATDYIVTNKQEKTTVAYAGNYDNEIESSAHADISISLGCHSDADICTDSDSISCLPELFSCASRSVKIQKICIYASLISKVIVASLLILGLNSPLIAAPLLIIPAIFSFLINDERIRL